ncbi:MAG: hypothetical protein FRX49_05090 [Trebouxia sp. A1-2]|nr:MAG: hypothetical protein FRX49_05090 [Trebouxia sp. A1-2]
MLCPSKSKGEVPGLSASEQRTFLQSLWEHLCGNGMVQSTTQCAVAEVEGKVVSAARLYRAVGLRGGFDNVSKRDWWRSIGQEFGTSAAADSVWRSKYEVLLKGYEDKYLDASKYCSKANAVVSSVNRQYASSSDSPAVSTAAESQPSSSSSCLDGVGPSIQSGPTMESSATASPSQDRLAPTTHQPVAHSTQAASSLSNGRPPGGTDNAQPQHQHPTSLQCHPKQSDRPVGLQKQQGQQTADRQLHLAETQPQKAETQLQKAEPQPAQRGSSPKTNGSLGIKRSASGEAASASAKKQKATPLATYQQAQEHLKAQMARQGAQHGENRKIAEDMLKGIAPSLGPLLTVPSDFASSHVIASGLKEEGGSVGDCDECLTPAERLLPRRQPQPKPGEAQGWWWEKEEGLLAPQAGAGWAFTHACCACNVLRNLAMESSNHAALVGQAAVAALVQCLEARREQPCPDTNDLALNALDCLHKVAPRLQLAGLPSQLLWQLLSEVCHSMMAHDTPLRVRGTAAGVVQRLAQETQNLGSLADAAEDGSLGLLEHLSALLRVDIVQAQQQVLQELAGSLGRPDIYVNSLSQKDCSAMALNLQAQTLADAAKAVSELVRYQELRLKQAVASNRHLMVSLIQMLLSEHMQELDSWHKSTTRERLKYGLHVHILRHFENAVQYSTAVLINVSELPAAQDKLRVYEMRIAELAMTDSPQKEWVATLLSRIGPAPDGV